MGAVRESRVDISVIVTVHNAEKYLQECIESVLGQTYKNIEVLCVDGGSTDASPQILREYALKDERIRIINDTNTSYGHKVNQGIRLAQGKYISVLESDDMYLPEMLERLYAIAEQYQPDFVNADYLEFWDMDGNRYQRLMRMYPESDYDRLLESGKHPEEMRQILRYWTGIFRKDFLMQKEIWMNESSGASFQDMSFRFLTTALAETSYHLSTPVYLYRVDNIFSSVYDSKKAVVIADEFNFLKSELERRKIDNHFIWQHFYTWKYNDFYGNLVRFDKEARQALLERCYHELNIDREVLKEREMGECSRAINIFLEKMQSDVEEEIEASFQALLIRKGRQEKIYRMVEAYRLVIFGCGAIGKRIWNDLYSMRNRICCFTDNDSTLWGTQRNGCIVLNPNETVNRYPNALYIVANMSYASDIVQQLQSMGISEEMIIIY